MLDISAYKHTFRICTT